MRSNKNLKIMWLALRVIDSELDVETSIMVFCILEERSSQPRNYEGGGGISDINMLNENSPQKNVVPCQVCM